MKERVVNTTTLSYIAMVTEEVSRNGKGFRLS